MKKFWIFFRLYENPNDKKFLNFFGRVVTLNKVQRISKRFAYSFCPLRIGNFISFWDELDFTKYFSVWYLSSTHVMSLWPMRITKKFRISSRLKLMMSKILSNCPIFIKPTLQRKSSDSAFMPLVSIILQNARFIQIFMKFHIFMTNRIKNDSFYLLKF